MPISIATRRHDEPRWPEQKPMKSAVLAAQVGARLVGIHTFEFANIFHAPKNWLAVCSCAYSVAWSLQIRQMQD
jgi:hypothetical protein